MFAKYKNIIILISLFIFTLLQSSAQDIKKEYSLKIVSEPTYNEMNCLMHLDEYFVFEINGKKDSLITNLLDAFFHFQKEHFFLDHPIEIITLESLFALDYVVCGTGPCATSKEYAPCKINIARGKKINVNFSTLNPPCLGRNLDSIYWEVKNNILEIDLVLSSRAEIVTNHKQIFIDLKNRKKLDFEDFYIDSCFNNMKVLASTLILKELDDFYTYNSSTPPDYRIAFADNNPFIGSIIDREDEAILFFPLLVGTNFYKSGTFKIDVVLNFYDYGYRYIDLGLKKECIKPEYSHLFFKK